MYAAITAPQAYFMYLWKMDNATNVGPSIYVALQTLSMDCGVSTNAPNGGAGYVSDVHQTMETFNASTGSFSGKARLLKISNCRY